VGQRDGWTSGERAPTAEVGAPRSRIGSPRSAIVSLSAGLVRYGHRGSETGHFSKSGAGALKVPPPPFV
jgi:hypothetical protein